ncbi:insulinase family protein [Clostridiaceae bacterium UIB06]|uniref:Insulinase family protein n=1 Tax=Clostridium thailandense TaxID=2794346 RepID=A0A949TJS7_9CLOT|nr:pitrilysin family protein [Clostridium thailandense]MBV7271817.1 insulinase family protein [Clostridium thailandense]MCH5135613.1 insulinase family protein [Clostridiaceae bacterium UIB06]
MKKYILENGMKLIYEYRPAEITSFCIGFNAGAIEEGREFKLGTAHAVEHMVSKETKNRTEKEINELCDEVFGFENAMTNFPYVIYYGTSLSQDFSKAIELYSDIVLNPTFPEKGFREEMNIILEELKEWKDDIYQYCEDSLLYNAFSEKRIKNLIIGTEESVNSLTLKELRKFYNKYYAPQNCVISACSSLTFEDILKNIEKYFGNWNKSFCGIEMEKKEVNKAGIFMEKITNIKGAKIQYLFNIDNLNEEELKALNVFNTSFGEGTSSVLFDEIRTKRGLAYDVGSLVKQERGMKFFTINIATSNKNVDEVLRIVDDSIFKVKNKLGYFDEKKINSLVRNMRLKRELKLEKSIQLCKELTTYELMFNSSERVYSEVENLKYINEKKVLEVLNRVLQQPSIQILRPKI